MAVIDTAPWKKGDIIRNAKNGKPYLVIHIYTNLATLVADPQERQLQPPVLLLQRDYKEYARDCDMDCIIDESLFDTTSDIIKWNFKPAHI